MDRQIVYPGQIPLETDLLNTNKNAMTAIAKLAAAIFGTSSFVNGFACTPNSPADMTVFAAAGEVYSLQNIDNTAYSSVAADTTHQILKQGIILSNSQLSCPAPGTVGFSINYLVQVAFTEADTNTSVLPYYNASNPSQAWAGMNNNGLSQATLRQNTVTVGVKAGAAAATGTQTTPSPDAGYIGLWVVTVANGQTSITSGNISQYSGAPFIPQGGAASGAINSIYTKSVAGNTDVTLTAQEAAYPIINLTGALTGNINLIVPATTHQWIINNGTSGSFSLTVKTQAGTGVIMPANASSVLYCNGTNVISAGSGGSNTFTKTTFSATAGQTAFSVSYTPGNIFVTRNGVMVPFTGTNGTSITLTTAANLNDVVEVYAFSSFSVANALTVSVAAATYASQAQVANTNGFRLTLTSGTPVTTADVSGVAATTIYCTPYKGNQIGLYDGANWHLRSSAEFSLALGTLTASLCYDVFCYDNAGTPTLEFLAWTNATTRATALGYQDGILVKFGDATRRYLGTFYTSSTTQTRDDTSHRYLWNYYNRVSRRLAQYSTTASWTYSTAAWRQANADTANQLNFVIGWPEDSVDAFVQGAFNGSGAYWGAVGIGYDSTTVAAGTYAATFAAASAIPMSTTAKASVVPAVGFHYLAWLEQAQTSATTTWYGNGGTANLTGLDGRMMA